jgi:hypothetical protein
VVALQVRKWVVRFNVKVIGESVRQSPSLNMIPQWERFTTNLALSHSFPPVKKGWQVGVLHTPDFFVLDEQNCGWIEWTMEEQLVQLAEQMPHRSHRGADDTWVCPPGSADANPLGFFSRIQSSASASSLCEGPPQWPASGA